MGGKQKVKWNVTWGKPCFAAVWFGFFSFHCLASLVCDWIKCSSSYKVVICAMWTHHLIKPDSQCGRTDWTRLTPADLELTCIQLAHPISCLPPSLQLSLPFTLYLGSRSRADGPRGLSRSRKRGCQGIRWEQAPGPLCLLPIPHHFSPNQFWHNANPTVGGALSFIHRSGSWAPISLWAFC